MAKSIEEIIIEIQVITSDELAEAMLSLEEISKELQESNGSLSMMARLNSRLPPRLVSIITAIKEFENEIRQEVIDSVKQDLIKKEKPAEMNDILEKFGGPELLAARAAKLVRPDLVGESVFINMAIFSDLLDKFSVSVDERKSTLWKLESGDLGIVAHQFGGFIQGTYKDNAGIQKSRERLERNYNRHNTYIDNTIARLSAQKKGANKKIINHLDVEIQKLQGQQKEIYKESLRHFRHLEEAIENKLILAKEAVEKLANQKRKRTGNFHERNKMSLPKLDLRQSDRELKHAFAREALSRSNSPLSSPASSQDSSANASPRGPDASNQATSSKSSMWTSPSNSPTQRNSPNASPAGSPVRPGAHRVPKATSEETISTRYATEPLEENNSTRKLQPFLAPSNRDFKSESKSVPTSPGASDQSPREKNPVREKRRFSLQREELKFLSNPNRSKIVEESEESLESKELSPKKRG